MSNNNSSDSNESNTNQNRSLLPSLVTGQLEMALNKALGYAPATKMRLKRLAGKSLGLNLRNPAVQLTLIIERKGVRTLSYLEENPDAVITGPCVTVVRQLAKNSTTSQWLASGIELTGDIDLVQQVSSILAEQDFDIEEPLSELIGDVAAHQLARATRGAFGLLKKAGIGKTRVSKTAANNLHQDADTPRDD
ncbi:MAG: hypothetical protein CSA49_03265 [Gammaproteobacteria bacterium]|nr:MAG: hypothetical protein CSA49_03265 [Gammaproteobacteria bacterium]